MHIKTQIAFRVRNTLCVLTTCLMVVMTMVIKRMIMTSVTTMLRCAASGLQETVNTDNVNTDLANVKAAKGV